MWQVSLFGKKAFSTARKRSLPLLRNSGDSTLVLGKSPNSSGWHLRFSTTGCWAPFQSHLLRLSSPFTGEDLTGLLALQAQDPPCLSHPLRKSPGNNHLSSPGRGKFSEKKNHTFIPQKRTRKRRGGEGGRTAWEL